MKQEKCYNCGNSLSINEAINNEIKCSYCRTIYHVDNLGMVEEYKVKIKMHGKIVHFYIGSTQIEPNMIETTTIDARGRMYCERIGEPQITLTLHSFKMEDE